MDKNTRIAFELKRILWIKYIIYALFIGFVILYIYIFQVVDDFSKDSMTIFWLTIIYVTIFGGINLYLYNIRCPNCKEFFFLKIYKKNLLIGLSYPFRNCCISCGISLKNANNK